MKSYLIASFLTAAIGQLNGLVDSILMGNFIGPNALTAITLSIPALTIIGLFYMLLASGAAVEVSRAIGAREMDKVADIFSVSIISLTVIGGLVSILTCLSIDTVTQLLCDNEEIFPYALKYLKWTTALSLLTMLSQAFSQFTDIDGKPLMVTKSLLITFVVNILFDIILVRLLDLGIEGAAIASAVSVTASGLYLLRYILSGNSSYRFKVRVPGFMGILKENVKNGFAMRIGILLMCGFMVFMNNTIISCLGAEGMFIMSIATGVMGLCSLLATATSHTFVAVGGMLFGQKDYQGMRLLYNRCLAVVLTGSIVFSVVGLLFPEVFATAYGAKDETQIANVASGIRIFSLMLIPFQLNSFIPSVYKVMGHMKLVGLLSMLFYLLLAPVMYLFSISDTPEHIWWSFPIASFSVTLIRAICLVFIHRKKPDCGFVSLIPNQYPFTNMLDISISCQTAARDEAFVIIRNFIMEISHASQLLKDSITICVEEMLDNIVQFSGMSASHYIDLRITCEEKKITVMTKDNGPLFDPISFDKKKHGLGMTMITSLCPQLDYKYMYGQNMSFMGWEMDE